jgi:hypothetical protein
MVVVMRMMMMRSSVLREKTGRGHDSSNERRKRVEGRPTCCKREKRRVERQTLRSL